MRMFEKFKKRSQQQEIIKPQIAKEPEQEKIKNISKEHQINNEPETPTIVNEPEKEIIKEPKVEEKPEITYSKASSTKETKSEFMAIKDYSSFSQLTEMINKEISQSKSKLGEYYLQIDKMSHCRMLCIRHAPKPLLVAVADSAFCHRAYPNLLPSLLLRHKHPELARLDIEYATKNLNGFG